MEKSPDNFQNENESLEPEVIFINDQDGMDFNFDECIVICSRLLGNEPDSMLNVNGKNVESDEKRSFQGYCFFR